MRSVRTLVPLLDQHSTLRSSWRSLQKRPMPKTSEASRCSAEWGVGSHLVEDGSNKQYLKQKRNMVPQFPAAHQNWIDKLQNAAMHGEISRHKIA